MKRRWSVLLGGIAMALVAWAQPSAAIRDLDALLRLGHYTEAAQQARLGIASLERAGQGDSLDCAALLAHLAEALWVGGRVADPETRKAAERALEIRERVLSAEDPTVAQSLRDLGNVFQMLGDYVAARPLLDRALAIQKKALGPEHAEIARTVSMLAVLLYRTGDIGGAAAMFAQALSIHEKTAGPQSLAVAQDLNDLAVAYCGLNECAKAKPLHERALAIRIDKLGPEHFQVAASLNNLSMALQRTGDRRGALALQERAITIREKTLGPEHPNVANGLNNMAMLRMELKEYGEARALLEKSLTIREKAYGPWHWQVAQSLQNLSAALRGEAVYERAFAAGLRSEEIARTNLQLTMRTLAEGQVAMLLTSKPAGLDNALAILADGRLPGAAETRLAWDAVIRSRALAFDEMLARKQALADLYGAGMAADATALYAARQRYTDRLTAKPGADAAKDRAALSEARLDMERSERSLADRSVRFRKEVERAAIGATEVEAALPAGSVAVSYLLYQPNFPSEERSYLAFVFRAGGGQPHVVPLGPRGEIDRLVAAWRAQIAREAEAPGRSAKLSEAACRRAGNALRQRIWDPVAAHTAGARRVFVVPDGALHLVAFAALPAASGGYLVEAGPLVHLLNTEKDLVPGRESHQGQGLLAVGDVDYGAGPAIVVASLRGGRANCVMRGDLQFDRLPATGREVNEVASIWNLAHGRAVVLRGAAASGAAFRDAAPGKRILHLATHGVFFESACTSGDTGEPQRPMLSGLALAGANHPSNRQGSGILTAEEIMSLDLDGVEWVVLSGCDTALGRIQDREGVFGLRRSFQLAGARTVIMSLWPADDGSSREWMRRLYQARFTAALGTAEAVQRATAGLLRTRRAKRLSTHPFYWGNFVAAGDWR